jgi:transposase
VIRLGELVMILDLHRQGLSVSAIARQLERDRKTVRKYIERGLAAPAYSPREPRPAVVTPFAASLRDRIAAFPELTGSRLLREIRELGYAGGYTAVKDFLRTIRPRALQAFERSFETPPGKQAQVDFAFFRTVFTDQPDAERIICGAGLSPTRICRPFCAAISAPSRRSAARRLRSSMIA